MRVFWNRGFLSRYRTVEEAPALCTVRTYLEKSPNPSHLPLRTVRTQVRTINGLPKTLNKVWYARLAREDAPRRAVQRRRSKIENNKPLSREREKDAR